MAIIRFFAMILLSLGLISAPFAEYTPYENRAYNDSGINVEPEKDKYIKMTATGEGEDICPTVKNVRFYYRYGPSMILNADGSIDAYFSAPGVDSEWDWITYRHSPDGGKTWTDETSVLSPTPESADFYSCCDPGVVKFGEYYYLAYTSTVHKDGIINDVFVARSRYPDKGFEKWNGNGWGGKPQPIVKYTGNPSTYGAGEPSMVVVGDVLYVYYTWRDGALNQTRVSVADATDENWPATLSYKGVAIEHDGGAVDSADVKYVEDFGKFMAVSTMDRFTTESLIVVYVSDDGLNFEKSCYTKVNISHCCHNCGITSRPDGHIRLSDKIFLAYAYGDLWGHWPTRMNEVKLTLTDEPDFSEYDEENVKTEVVDVRQNWFTDYIGITTKKRVYEENLDDGSFMVNVLKVDSDRNASKAYCNVTFDGYDESIVSFDGKRFLPKNEGETYVTAHWEGHETVFLIRIVK